MQALEQEHCLNKGISLLDLMEEAGSQVAAYISQNYTHIQDQNRSILIFCGPGNNGGDGFVAARKLREEGFNVELLLVNSARYSESLQSQIELLKEQAEATQLPQFRFIEKDRDDQNRISLATLDVLFEGASLVVDCLLGTGQQGAPRDLLGETVNKILEAKKASPLLTIISVDIPTGIDSDTGALHSPYIIPDETLVLQHFKLGMVQSPALDSIGRPVLLDIGLEDSDSKYHLIPDAEIPSRPVNAHKGNYGHVLVVAGSKSMPGAGLLSATACMRAGAGLTTIISTGETYANSYPEIMYQLIDQDLNIAARDIIASLDKYNCLVIGPGLGRGQAQTGFVYQLLREVSARNIKCVLDADGLNALAELQSMSVPLNLPSVIITPHPGEAARLLQVSTIEIQSNRYMASQKLAEKFGCGVILKGQGSIYFSSGSGAVNTSGGPFLATAGSGDVLTGILAAFLAAGYKNAAENAVFLHGLAGELAHAEHNGPIIASDIIAKIPYAIGKHTN